MKRIPQGWAGGTGQDITTIFKGVGEILARLAEPLMRYSTVYLALATALPVIKYVPAYDACIAIVISAPEFVLIGALAIAETAIKSGNKKWGSILFVVSGLLALIMVATFVDIFIYSFPEIAMKILNFSRCLTAVGFSIVLSKLGQVQEEDAQNVATPQPVAVTATPAINPDDIVQGVMSLLQEQVATLRGDISNDLISVVSRVTEIEQRVTSLQGDKRHDGVTVSVNVASPDTRHEEIEQAVTPDTRQRRGNVTRELDTEPVATQEQATAVNDTAWRIRDYAMRHPHATRQQIADACGVSLRTVQRHMRGDNDGEVALRVV